MLKFDRQSPPIHAEYGDFVDIRVEKPILRAKSRGARGVMRRFAPWQSGPEGRPRETRAIDPGARKFSP